MKPDWDWTSELADPKDITLEHRRLAAGLGPGPSCALPQVRAASSLSSKVQSAHSADGDCGQDGAVDVANLPKGVKRSDRKEDEDSDSSVIFVKSNACTAKRCKTSPRCYNHLGFEKVRRH